MLNIMRRVGVFVFCVGFTSTLAITTHHHDKPDSLTVATITTTPAPKILISTARSTTINATLSPTERKKRLLPYQNFYFDQPFNRPHKAGVSAQQYQDYEPVRPNKSPEFENVSFRPQNDGYHRQKFTPFSETNALPGPFRPMINSPHHSQPKYQYIIVDQSPDEELEINHSNDFSAIYEKLSQLKLRQQAMTPKPSYGYRLTPTRYRPQTRPSYDVPRYKIQPSKTTFETFTATNIDIPVSREEQEHYHPTARPNRFREKPFRHHQVAIEVPQASIPLTFGPRKPIKDRPIYYVVPKAKPRKPKPAPAVVVEENYVNEKYVPKPEYQEYHVAPVYETPTAPEQEYQREVVKPEPGVQYYQYQTIKPVTSTETVTEYLPVSGTAPEQGYQPEVVTPQPGLEYYQYQTIKPVSSTQAATDYEPVRGTHKIPLYEEYVTTPEPSKDGGLAAILEQLQQSNTLPKTLTADNIDNSIKTLVRILDALKDRQKQQHQPVTEDTFDYDNEAGVDLGGGDDHNPDGGTPGKAGVDYPALSSIPKTTFNCKTQRYKGFFGDPDTNCQVWHYCDLNGGQASFLCPNGTIFSQVALTCDWWYNVKCASTAQLYVLNERLYKYIIPLSPKFPEDYSGPLVDKYLAMKFQEMEEKLKRQKKGKGNKDSSEESGDDDEEEEETEQEEEETDNAATIRSDIVESTTVDS